MRRGTLDAKTRRPAELTMLNRQCLPPAKTQGMAAYPDAQDRHSPILRYRRPLCAHRRRPPLGQFDRPGNQPRLFKVQRRRSCLLSRKRQLCADSERCHLNTLQERSSTCRCADVVPGEQAGWLWWKRQQLLASRYDGLSSTILYSGRTRAAGVAVLSAHQLLPKSPSIRPVFRPGSAQRQEPESIRH